MTSLLLLIACAHTTEAPAAAPAGVVAPGDTPSVQATTHQGVVIDDASLRGRYVVLEFIRSGDW